LTIYIGKVDLIKAWTICMWTSF